MNVNLDITSSKVKEVVPLKTKESLTEFFHTDIKIARQSYQTHKNYESRGLYEQFIREKQKLKDVTKNPDEKTEKNLKPQNVKMIMRKNLQTIVEDDNVQDITRRLGVGPIKNMYNFSSHSLSSLASETKQTVTTRKVSNTSKNTPNTSPERKFEVVTYPDDVSNKDKVVKEQEKEAVEEKKKTDSLVKKQLEEFDEKILRKDSNASVNQVEIIDFMECTNPELRDEDISVEEQAQRKLANLFVNPQVSFTKKTSNTENTKDNPNNNPNPIDTCKTKSSDKSDAESVEGEAQVSKPLLKE